MNNYEIYDIIKGFFEKYDFLKLFLQKYVFFLVLICENTIFQKI